MKDNKLNFTERKLKTIKENKLIAEFMGHEFTLMPDTDGKCYTEKDSWDVVHEDDFWVDGGWYAYNTSWNGLMPVVEKISDAKSWSINATLEWLSESQDRDGFYDRDGIFQSVVEFINQLNR